MADSTSTAKGDSSSDPADVADSTSTAEGNSSSESRSATPTPKYDLEAPTWFLAEHVYLDEDLESFTPSLELVDHQSADSEQSCSTPVQKTEETQAEDHLQKTVVISQDTYDELDDLVGSLEYSGAVSTIVFSTEDIGYDHVARALLAGYAAKNGADLMTLDFEMLEILAINFNQQVESQSRAEHQPSDEALDLWSDNKPSRPSKVADEVNGNSETAGLAEDRVRKDIFQPTASCLHDTSNADSDAGDDSTSAGQSNVREKVAQARRSASMQVILEAVEHKKSILESDKASPLLVLLEAVYTFSANKKRHENMVRMLMTGIESMLSEGQVVRFFVSTTSAHVQRSQVSCGCWDCNNLKNYKVAETSVVKLHGNFARDPYVRSRLLCRRIMADHKEANAQLRMQHPDSAQLSSIETCSNVLQDNRMMAYVAKQLGGRYAKRKALFIDDIVQITKRVARRALQRSEYASEELGLNDYEKQLYTTKVDASQIEETFEDVIMDAQVMERLQLRLKLALLPVSDLPRGLAKGLHTSGILLHGPPGTGKTQLARAIANSKKATMLAIAGADVQSEWVGETEKQIKAAFSLARKLHPCILFFDEADALFFRRSSGDKSWERNAINQFLTEMDGLTKLDRHPLVVVATNRMEDIDRAFLRRLPHHIAFELPKEEQRARMLRLHSRQAIRNPDINFDELARLTDRMSGSDIQTLCQSALLESYFDRQSDSNSTDVNASDLLVRHSHFLRALRTQSQNLRQAKQSTLHAHRPG